MTGAGGQHMRRRSWWARTTTIGAVAVVGLVGAGTAGAVLTRSDENPAANLQRREAAQQAKNAALAAAVTRSEAAMIAGVSVSPADGTSAVPLDATVTVKSTQGTITSVTLAGASGAPVAGNLAPDRSSWSSAGLLNPSSAYTLTVHLARAGLEAVSSYRFTTVTPTRLVSASVYPTTGMTVGVGQPIVVGLNHDVYGTAARQAIENAFTVAMSQPVPGGWYWFSPHELHFRPEAYWPAHEQIEVTGTIAGIDLGNGAWGTGNAATDSFAIGDARISYANLATERMTVTLNGQTLYTYPISGGRPQYPTMDGDHIVLDRQSVVHMVSSTVGIPVNSPNGYNELVYWDVHISDSGEYVHAAPWSVSDQGVTNVSHGCINLSPANAQSYFNFSRVGDVVEVTGSPRPPVAGDHGVMDWSTPWGDWAPAHVVALGSTGGTSTPASPTTTAAPGAATAEASAPGN